MMNMHPGGSVKSKLFLLAIVLAAATTNLTHAHHSFAASYFPDKTTTIDGKVVQFLFRNPHSFLDVAAPDEKRHDQTWVVEWGGGGQLSRAGVSKDTLKPGDHVVARRFGVVLRHALAGVVERAQVELCVRIALVGGPAVPACRLGVVFGHALAVIVQESEIVRRLCVPLPGGLAEPAYGFGVVLANPLAVAIHPAQRALGLDVAFCGSVQQCLERFGSRRTGRLRQTNARENHQPQRSPLIHYSSLLSIS